MTEQDFKNIMQTEIGALVADGKSDSRLCMALREVSEWMGSTAFQYRKKYFEKKNEPEEPQETKKELPVYKGFWIKPEGATPKSYKWRCSVCGKEAHYAPSGKKGEDKKCDYPYCPFCGNQMEL